MLPAVPIAVELLGGFGLVLDGERLAPAAFARRDATHLVELLALTAGHRMHRERVVDALWPDVAHDVVGNRLHKAAHFVRRATGRPDSIVLEDGQVALFPGSDVTVDVDRFEAAASSALRNAEIQGAERAAAMYAGELLPFDPYEPWAGNIRQRLALRHLELLRLLGRYDEIVAVDATDEDAHVGLMRRMAGRGDVEGVERQFALLTRVLEDELGLGPSDEAIAVRDGARAAGPRRAATSWSSPPTTAARYTSLATQTVHRCTTVDGVRIAYATSGSGPPLVKASTWLTHVDYDWHSPVWRHWWEALSRHHTLVRYDERGCGLSDWDVDDCLVRPRAVGPRPRDRGRRPRPGAVPPARHLPGRADRRHVRRPAPRTGEPPRHRRDVHPRDMGARVGAAT